MKTLEQIKTDWKFVCIDGRDLTRLSKFIPEDQLKDFELELNDDYKGTHEAKPFTRENILEQLKEDVEFGFVKALNQRGISASLMAEVVKMREPTYRNNS